MADGVRYSVYSFVVNSMVRGYHQYKDIWHDPIVGEELPCEREVGNPHDPLAVAINETMAEEGNLLLRVPLGSGKGSSTDLTDSLKYFKIDISSTRAHVLILYV